MPIYEYRCNSCGHQKEFLQRLNDKPLTKCPECGKRTFSKLLSAAGFQLKGSGWYATDFKNGGTQPAAKSTQSADSAKPAETATKESTKTEAVACGAGASPSPACN